MTTLELKGDWNITKGKLKQKWAALTGDDLQFVEGKHEERRALGLDSEADGRNPRSGRKSDQGILFLLRLQLKGSAGTANGRERLSARAKAAGIEGADPAAVRPEHAF